MKRNSFKMRWLFICLTIFVISISSQAQSKTKRLTLVQNTSSTSQSINAKYATPPLKRWEIRIAPIALLARWLTLDVSYHLNENWATGPALINYTTDSNRGGMLVPTYKGYAIGWQGNYFTSALKDGLYLSAHAYYESYKNYPHSFQGYYQKDGYKLNSALGYRWKWKPVVLMTGVGAEYLDHSVTEYTEVRTSRDSKQSNSRPFIEVKLGIEI